MRRYHYKPRTKFDHIMDIYIALVKGELYTLNTGKNIGDFEAALRVFVGVCEQYLEESL